MKKTFRISFIVLLVLALAALITYYLLNHDIAVLEPDGMIAKKERDLFYDTALLMLLVVIPAIVLSLVFAWIYRATSKKAKYAPEWGESGLAEAIWWLVPFMIVVVLAIITTRSSHDLNPFKPIENGKKPLIIQAVALEWKWLFIYPEQGIATVNFIQIPEKRPIRFEITADAPMNSFWIPKLGGQIYAMPAMRSQLYLIADHPGTFRGRSSNISGTGFAGMTFVVNASEEEEFNDWVASVKKSGEEFTWESYLDLVKPSEYVPAAFYRLKEENLFELILQQYEPKHVGTPN